MPKQIDVLTHISSGDAGALFASWKKRTMGRPWSYALTGEWSTMSGTSGKRRFLYRRSADGAYWAIRLGTRIVAVAHSQEDAELEMTLGRMLGQLDVDGGEWVDSVFDAADGFNIDSFWSAFESASSR